MPHKPTEGGCRAKAVWAGKPRGNPLETLRALLPLIRANKCTIRAQSRIIILFVEPPTSLRNIIAGRGLFVRRRTCQAILINAACMQAAA